MQTTASGNKIAQAEYRRAVRHGFWRRLSGRLGNRCDDLVAASDLLKRLHGFHERNLGLKQIPLNSIVGSNRIRDFDLYFYPKGAWSEDRWLRVAEAMLAGIPLPPLRLIKLGDRYLVLDGNHRISVARALGFESMKAIVIELSVGNIEPNPSCTRLGFRPQGRPARQGC